MSPKSRGRTPRNRSRRDHRRSPGAPQASPGVRLLQELDRELQDTDTLSAEIAASALLGAARLPRLDDTGAGLVPADVVVDVVRQAGRVRRPTSLGLLRCLAHLGDPDQRDLVATSIHRLTEAGVPEPAWATGLDDVAATGAWRMGDVYGDAETIAVEFARPGRPHALVVLVDHTQGGAAVGAFVDEDPDGGRVERDQHSRDPLVVVEDLDLGTARTRVEAAFAVADAADPSDLEDDLVAARALALARLRALPAGASVPPRPLDEAGRAALVGDFLASSEAAHLRHDPAAERCVRSIVALRSAADPADPLRTGPGALADLLLDRLPGADLAEEEAAALPGVVVAWARFAARRTDLPAPAVDHLVAAAEELADAYRAVRSDPWSAGGSGRELAMSYADGLLEEGVEPPAVQDAIARRTFAMPAVGTTIGGEEFSYLDPADPDDRALLIAGEHPEYRAALEDPFSDAEIDGVNPRAHLAIHEMVASQLWDDDPPEVWQAAQRLLAAGLERHDILHELGAVATEFLWRALKHRRPVDLDAYRASLAALAALPAARPGRHLRPAPEE